MLETSKKKKIAILFYKNAAMPGTDYLKRVKVECCGTNWLKMLTEKDITRFSNIEK